MSSMVVPDVAGGAGVTDGSDPAFPVLTAAQLDRIARHGRIRTVNAGEVLLEPASPHPVVYVVRHGAVEILRASGGNESRITVQRAGQFTGEVNMLTGRRSIARVRVAESGDVIELERESLLRLIQTDSEIGQIIVRAYILRRAKLVAGDFGDVVLVGSTHCAGTLRVREFLTRNGHPFRWIDLDTDTGVQAMLDQFQVGPRDIPVVICCGQMVLRNPTNQQIADSLGFNEAVDLGEVRDVVIVGAGPSGLGAAVYAASEGLNTLVIETEAPGGQAGSSSRIENYLGFPNGVSGQELAGRAYTQALKFGAELIVAKSAVQLSCERRPYVIQIDGGERIAARTVIIATGAQYRKPDIEGLGAYEGIGVYYGATPMEGQLCAGDEVVIVGGGNSAGQAAVFLAGQARHVHILVRGTGLAETMSRYLISRIEGDPSITLHTQTELVELDGAHHLERIAWRHDPTGAIERHDIRHVFIMTGAVPGSTWVAGCVSVDDKGFIKTGTDLSPDDLTAAGWPLKRPPHPLESSLPSVFAVGDVRAGSMKRVAAAVGEGAGAVALVHRVLGE